MILDTESTSLVADSGILHQNHSTKYLYASQDFRHFTKTRFGF